MNEKRGMKTFLTVWLGQLVSVFGSRLTSFALGLWVLERTGSVTQFSLLLLCVTIPAIAASLLAGPLVDRADRRKLMLLADTGAGLCSLALAALLLTGHLEVWSVTAILAVSTVLSTLQVPAYTASISLLVPREQLGRANGLVELGNAFAQVFAPLAAGVLLHAIGARGVILIDAATYLVALATLLAVRIPRPERPAAAEATARPSLVADAREGWAFVRSGGGLLALLALSASFNFSSAMVDVLMAPMLLAFASVALVGTVVTVFGAGMLGGGLTMSAWGGPKRRARGIALFGLLQGLALVAAGLRPSVPLIAAAMFCWAFCGPIVSGSEVAVWQSRTRPELQGRVFALRTAVSFSALPLAFVLAGPLADRVFGPALQPGGALAGTLGALTGVGPGRGLAVMIIALGLLTMAACATGALSGRLSALDEAEEHGGVPAAASSVREMPEILAVPEEVRA
jgi:MFS family permease